MDSNDTSGQLDTNGKLHYNMSICGSIIQYVMNIIQ